MYSAADIEIQLWEYIDNVCDNAMRERIVNLIATDKVWKEKYAELMAFHSELQQIEAEHTSMRFTKNVMEQIAGTHVAQPTKSYINKWVVRGIAAVFVLLIGFVLVYSLSNLQWSNEPKPATKPIDYSSIFNDNFVVYVVLANILVGIVIVDMLIRRRKGAAH
jgi:hypothetical protein